MTSPRTLTDADLHNVIGELRALLAAPHVSPLPWKYGQCRIEPRISEVWPLDNKTLARAAVNALPALLAHADALLARAETAERKVADHERFLPDIVQERLDEINAEAEAFDRDAIKALTFIMKHHCGEAGAEMLSDHDGWSTDQAIACIAEEFQRLTAAEAQLAALDSRAAQEDV